MFQSTPPRGRRPNANYELPLDYAVSIHASTREATSAFRRRASWTMCFNPRLHEGGDPSNLYVYSSHAVSIHASTREATATAAAPAAHRPRFNPRLHEGGDCISQ